MSLITREEMENHLESLGYQRYIPQIGDFDEEKENICFACSKRNPEGLQMEFFIHPDHNLVISPFIIEQKYCGYPIYSHGGIMTTLIDEVMSHVINHNRDCYAVTYEMKMNFFKPVLIGNPIVVVGRFEEEIESKSGKKIFLVSGEIRNWKDLSFSDSIFVQGKAKWIKLTAEILENLKVST